MTEILRSQHPCLLIFEATSNQKIYDSFSNTKLPNSLKYQIQVFKLGKNDNTQQKKSKSRLRLTFNISYALDKKVFED